MIKDIKKLDYFELASKPIKEIWEIFNATEEGHSSEKADQVRETYGDNEIDYGTEKSLWRTCLWQYRNTEDCNTEVHSLAIKKGLVSLPIIL